MKRTGTYLLSRPPFSTVLRAMAFRNNPTTVLCYHTLRPSSETIDAWTVLGLSDFLEQITFLRNNYEIVDLSEALARHGQSGRPRVVLTFDDGEWGLYEHLLPIIEDQKIPVTIYVATRQIETGIPYWFDRVMNALQVLQPVEIDLGLPGMSSFPIGNVHGKARWNQIDAVLKAIKAGPEGDRDRMADLVEAQAGAQTETFTRLRPMTQDQLVQLAAHPMVTIGAHSHGHELLDQLPIAEAAASIARSKSWLEEKNGVPVHHFAYPNGNYTADLMVEIAELGFETATILEERLMTATANLFAVPRIGVGRFDALDRLKLRMIGVR